ncbi:hypothetical protein BJ508DRAFT_325581 [Ascobolus immersus RN42]|uniref:DUF7918 domain-containing protein n=1 Tax=Ascobolus immersus RN42 TaxID=1160509 RepID=A0A3N4IDM3_ASCIM|nr:hypothetical protein BJ508DRAFT_325581 [Ascobolus immersus RN42]
MVIFNTFDHGIFTPAGIRLPEYPFEASPVPSPPPPPRPSTSKCPMKTPNPSPSASPPPPPYRPQHTATASTSPSTASAPPPATENDGTQMVGTGPMCFEKVQLSLEDEDEGGEIGTIEVVGRELVGLVEYGCAKVTNKGTRPGGVVGKARVGRGVSHTVRIGETVVRPAVRPKWDSVDSLELRGEGGDVTVRFLYRSKAALRSLGVEVRDSPVRVREIIEGTAVVVYDESAGCGLGRRIKNMFGKKKKEKYNFSEKN